ncbi:MAG: hypothetical protein ABI587_14775 [Gemmatimonadales bacterium]
MVAEVRSAGIEGFIILGAIYLVLNLLGRAGKKAAEGRTASPAGPRDEVVGGAGGDVSLEKILQEIQRVKRQKESPRALPAQRRQDPPTRKAAEPRRREQPVGDRSRGPLGRQSRTPLPAAEEVEERTSLEGTSLERAEQIEVMDDRPARRQRVEVDADDGAEAVAQRRIREAEARNRPLNAADHRRFDAQIRPAVTAEAPKAAAGRNRLQDAIVWREILGPPKSMQG